MSEDSNVMQEALREAQKVQQEKEVSEKPAVKLDEAASTTQDTKNEMKAMDPITVHEPKIDQFGRSYSTGKRKDAMARVWIKPGSGKIQVNGREVETYFARPVLRMIVNQPFDAVERRDQYDVYCTVKGGGLSGQAGALRHGISKALTLYEPGLRPLLKKGGFLTRDSRVVERKKYGRRKARRSFQFSKR